MEADVIKSYLVSLGFITDQVSYQKFERGLKSAGGLVTQTTGGILLDFLKWQIAVTGVFASVTGAVVGLADKAAMNEQEFRLMGERMFMTTEQAKRTKIALDALGEPLEAIAWDPELHGRFVQLIHDQERLQTMLGPDYVKQMHQLRDLRFELTRIEVIGQYLGMKFISDVFRGLGVGNGNILETLEKGIDYLFQHGPEMAQVVADDIVPAIKDFWQMLVMSKDLLGEFAHAFTVTVGVLSGDDSLQTSTTDLHQFATAVGDVIKFVAKLAEVMLVAEETAVGLAEALVYGVKQGRIPDFTQHVDKAGNTTFDLWGDGRGAGGTNLFNGMMARARQFSGQPNHPDMASRGGADPATLNQARLYAQAVSARTGIPAGVILSQWAFETGGFTNRGATSLHNLAGIRIPGTSTYRSFGSLDEFADYYSKMMTGPKYGDAMRGVTTPEGFAHAAKSKGYFESSEADYAAGMRRWMNTPGVGGAGGSTTYVGGVQVTIMQPNASPREIKDAVLEAIKEKDGKQVQRNLAELGGGYPN